MALKMSTGLKNKMLAGTSGSSSLRGILHGGIITIYTGNSPATPDSAVSGSLVCTFSAATFGTGSTAGTVSIVSGVVTGTCGIAGTAGYFRFSETGDSGSASTTTARIEGVIGTPESVGVDMTLVNTVLLSGQALTITTGDIGFPIS